MEYILHPLRVLPFNKFGRTSWFIKTDSAVEITREFAERSS